MNKRLIFLRHGKSEWNEVGKINSDTETFLSREGITQCNQLDNIIQELNIDNIISSPHMRAIQTAEILNAKAKKIIKIDDRLGELKFGQFEGYTMDFSGNEGLRNEFLSWHDENSPTTPDTVESFEECVARAESFLEDMVSEGHGSTLIITHGVFLRILLISCVIKSKPQLYKKLKVDNCGICIVEIEPSNSLRLTTLNMLPNDRFLKGN